MEIPLKYKYTHAMKGRFKGGERAAPLKHRDKINADEKKRLAARYGIPRLKTLLVNASTGHSKMVYMDDL